MKNISIDIETFSDIDLNKCGVYRYAESPAFEILLFGYAVDGGAVTVIDLAQGGNIPDEIIDALTDDTVTKWAFNANFERVCLSRYLRDLGQRLDPFHDNHPLSTETARYLNPVGWKCSMVWAATMGLPRSLKGVGSILKLEEQKMDEGKALIKYFSVPCASTKTNGGRTRNLPSDDVEKWETFKAYNRRDVEVEMARRRELGCFANKSLTLNCFSTKIKCGKCGRSFVRSTRTNRAKISQLGEHYIFWGCTSKKKTNCPSCKNGTIRETVLMEECAKVLGIPEFDEDVFTEKVMQITIPETGTLIFDFTDGTRLTHHWSRNSKKDSWTDECRKRASDYRREHAVTRDDITCFTTKIKCEHCGCNFRKSVSTMSDGTKRGYWRCADKNGCTVKGLRDDFLRNMAAEVLGLDEFDEDVFLEKIDRITVRDGIHLTFQFTDGGTAERDYTFKKEGKSWTEERRQKFMETRQSHPMSDEQKKAISERMKQIRKERGKAWHKEK